MSVVDIDIDGQGLKLDFPRYHHAQEPEMGKDVGMGSRGVCSEPAHKCGPRLVSIDVSRGH